MRIYEIQKRNPLQMKELLQKYSILKAHRFSRGMKESNFAISVYSIINIIHKICYNMLMKDIYKHTKTTVSLINYHFVFCPRYRRKIFLIPGVEDVFKKEAISIFQKNNIDILAMECHVDHVHIFVSVLPQMSIPEIMRLIKGGTSSVLRTQFKELSQMKSLWTRSYFVSTAGNVSPETIKWYVDTQKRRY